MTAAKRQEPSVKCVQYAHGGGRFYILEEDGLQMLLADTYRREATELVAKALGAKVEQAR